MKWWTWASLMRWGMSNLVVWVTKSYPPLSFKDALFEDTTTNLTIYRENPYQIVASFAQWDAVFYVEDEKAN